MFSALPIWQDVTDMERSIQALEEWAKSCNDITTLELRGIITQKILTLKSRLDIVQKSIGQDN